MLISQGIEAKVYLNHNSFVKEYHWYTFMREHKFLQHLSFSGISPNFISISRYKVQMEYLKGYQPLATLSNEKITFLLPKVIEVVKKLHSYKVLHNDLHLNNIMTNGHDVKLIDFNQSQFSNRGTYDFYCLKRNFKCRGISLEI